MITDNNPEEAHNDLARICLRYNQFSCFETDPERFDTYR